MQTNGITGWMRGTLEELTEDPILQKEMLSGDLFLDKCPTHGYITHPKYIKNCPVIVAEIEQKNVPSLWKQNGMIAYKPGKQVFKQACSLPFTSWIEPTT
jgi:hypothetical protein